MNDQRISYMASSRMHIFILTINFNTEKYTNNCIKSVLNSTYKDFSIHILDNASKNDELTSIKEKFSKEERANFYASEKNLGFAGGNNLLLKKIAHRAQNNDLILFLNNDTEVKSDLLEVISKSFENKDIDMAATKMINLHDKETIDNLGLNVSTIGLGKNRTNPSTPLFGPSGGCAIFTYKCLKDIKEKTGYFFDPDYFCYAEDVDLAWRALLLGYNPSYIDTTICYHAGGASSGGAFNKFVMYHTLRNWMFNLTKNMPTGLLLKQSLHIIGFQFALLLRYLFTGKIFTLLKVYKDFIKNFSKIRRKRRAIQKNNVIKNRELEKHFK